MFAIQINSDTLGLINERLQDDSVYKDQMETFARMENRWYYLRGYTAPRGAFYEEMVLPAFIVETQFELDGQDLSLIWGQIFRL